MSDPYQPPSSNIQRTNSPALYSVPGIVLATLVGSLAAGVVVLYLNYRSLNYRSLAEKAAIGGILAYLVLIGIAAFLPSSMLLGGLFIVIQCSIAYLAAQQLQGGAIDYHRQQGGSIHSNLRAAGMGLLTGMVIMIAFVVLDALIRIVAAG